MVRSGEGNYLFEQNREKNIITIGWNKLDDLTNIKKFEDIKKMMIENYPDSKPQLTSDLVTKMTPSIWHASIVIQKIAFSFSNCLLQHLDGGEIPPGSGITFFVLSFEFESGIPS